MKVLVLLLACAAPVFADPDLRQPQAAGPLTVYPDDKRPAVFYYTPGELAIATRADGSPDVHLLHARYTGSAATGDRGLALVRSIFSIRLVMAGPTPPQLQEARRRLAASTGRRIELRPLPIRRLESAVLYTPVAAPAAEPAAAHGQPAATAEPPAASQPTPEQPLPGGHFEAADAPAAASREGFWTERIYTLGLAPADAELLASSFTSGRLALSVGYAFLSEGIGPDDPLQQIAGSPALVQELKKRIQPAAPAAPAASTGAEADPPRLHVVRAGAIGVVADLGRWPALMHKIDINDSAPPGYAALDVYCYDFNQGVESPLYEKQVEMEADAVGGGRVRLTAIFNRSNPDLYARSLRFPVAVRLDRPYRYRVLTVAQDGSSQASPWQERPSWTELLDVTDQGDPK